MRSDPPWVVMAWPRYEHVSFWPATSYLVPFSLPFQQQEKRAHLPVTEMFKENFPGGKVPVQEIPNT